MIVYTLYLLFVDVSNPSSIWTLELIQVHPSYQIQNEQETPSLLSRDEVINTGSCQVAPDERHSTLDPFLSMSDSTFSVKPPHI